MLQKEIRVKAGAPFVHFWDPELGMAFAGNPLAFSSYRQQSLLPLGGGTSGVPTIFGTMEGLCEEGLIVPSRIRRIAGVSVGGFGEIALVTGGKKGIEKAIEVGTTFPLIRLRRRGNWVDVGGLVDVTKEKIGEEGFRQLGQTHIEPLIAVTHLRTGQGEILDLKTASKPMELVEDSATLPFLAAKRTESPYGDGGIGPIPNIISPVVTSPDGVREQKESLTSLKDGIIVFFTTPLFTNGIRRLMDGMSKKIMGIGATQELKEAIAHMDENFFLQTLRLIGGLEGIPLAYFYPLRGEYLIGPVEANQNKIKHSTEKAVIFAKRVVQELREMFPSET